MTESRIVSTASEAAVSQIMAALRRLAQKRDPLVYDGWRMSDILGGVMHEISDVLEPFTRGEARAALDVLVGQGKIELTKDGLRELYTLKVCSQNSK